MRWACASPVGERGERVFNGAADSGLVSVEETRPAAAVGRADVVPAVDCDTATVAAGTRTDVTPLPNGMRIVRGKDEHATNLVSLKSTEASGMGSLEPDAEVAKAAERLHVGRLGHRFAKRALDIVLSAANRRLNATTGATRRRWGDTHAKGPGFIPRALGRTICASLDITHYQRKQRRGAWQLVGRCLFRKIVVSYRVGENGRKHHRPHRREPRNGHEAGFSVSICHGNCV